MQVDVEVEEMPAYAFRLSKHNACDHAL
jgi:hypothetical protein